MMATKQNEVYIFDGRPNAKPKAQGPLDARLLCGKEVTIAFLDGKTLKGRVVEVDAYNLVIEYMGQKLLVPKHSIKFINLGG
jgi:sRNA-binding regulator protein Hfq